MLDFYTWNTPNGQKIYIALEEMGATYTAYPVDIGADEQFTDEYIAINPNSKIPALVDGEANRKTFESGAILIELAERYGKFLPQEHRSEVLSWLMFQMASVGPMFGQTFHFKMVAPNRVEDSTQLDYASTRFEEEFRRLLTVMEKGLEGKEYFATAYSIADMSLYPWVKNYSKLGVSDEEVPGIAAWCKRVAARPAVANAMSRAEADAVAHKARQK